MKEIEQITNNKEKYIATCMRWLSVTKEDAEDIYQDACIRLLRYPNNDKYSVNGYFITIMKHVKIDLYRKKMKLPISHMELVEDDKNIFHPDIDLYEEVIHKEIKQLPKRMRFIFELYLQGYKSSELASFFDVPDGTVRSNIYRAKKILQRRLIRA